MIRMFRLAPASLLLTAACANPMLSPTAPAPAEAPAAVAAKPPGGGPHTLTFSGYLAGNAAVTGLITGSYGSGNLSSTATGSYVITVNTVDPGDPTFCAPADLDTVRAALGSAADLVDAKSGSISISTTQASAVDGRTSLIWNVAGMAGTDGRTWEIGGNTTFNAPAYLSPDSNVSSLTVTHTNGVISFTRLAANGRKKDFSAGCRASFTMILASQ